MGTKRRLKLSTRRKKRTLGPGLWNYLEYRRKLKELEKNGGDVPCTFTPTSAESSLGGENMDNTLPAASEESSHACDGEEEKEIKEESVQPLHIKVETLPADDSDEYLDTIYNENDFEAEDPLESPSSSKVESYFRTYFTKNSASSPVSETVPRKSKRRKTTRVNKENVLGSEDLAVKNTNSGDSQYYEDEDKTFLMSLLPSMKALTVPQKNEFKRVVLSELNRISLSIPSTTVSAPSTNVAGKKVSNSTNVPDSTLATSKNSRPISFMPYTVPIKIVGLKNISQALSVQQNPVAGGNIQIRKQINSIPLQMSIVNPSVQLPITQAQIQLPLQCSTATTIPAQIRPVNENTLLQKTKSHENTQRVVTCTKEQPSAIFFTNDASRISHMDTTTTATDSVSQSGGLDDVGVQENNNLRTSSTSNEPSSDLGDTCDNSEQPEGLYSDITVEEIKIERIKDEPLDIEDNDNFIT